MLRPFFLAVWLLLVIDLARIARGPLPVAAILVHGVAENPGPGDAWTLTPAEFEGLLARLVGEGFHTLEPDEVQAALDGRLPRERTLKGFVFTVDDGRTSDRDRVKPQLEAAGFTGMFFVCPGLGPPDFLDATGIRSLQGPHAVGAHGLTHMSLSPSHHGDPGPGGREDLIARIDQELVGSRAALQEMLGRPVTAMAYPRGEYDATTLERAARAGYTMAFTTDIGFVDAWTPPLEIPRLQVTRNLPLELVTHYLETPKRESDRRFRLEGILAGLLMLYLVGSSVRSGDPGTGQSGAAPVE